MPELPEVESLAAFLREHATGHAVARADAASFSVLKTFDPPLTALTMATLAGLLAGRRTRIKGVLRDQHIIAGIGNAYSDEVLHAAKMSPFKMASSLTPDDVAVLYDAIKTTLGEAVERSAGLAAA